MATFSFKTIIESQSFSEILLEGTLDAGATFDEISYDHNLGFYPPALVFFEVTNLEGNVISAGAFNLGFGFNFTKDKVGLSPQRFPMFELTANQIIINFQNDTGQPAKNYKFYILLYKERVVQ